MLTLRPQSIYIFHLLVVVPLLLYLGYYQNRSNRLILQGLPFMILAGSLFHGYRLYQHLSRRGFRLNFNALVNILHLLVVFPVLYQISRDGGRMDPRLARALPIVGLIALSYHGNKLYQSL